MKGTWRPKVLMAVLCGWLWSAALAAMPDNADDQPQPSLAIGAKVYHERCTLCHGNEGMGEGLLPLKLKKYPNTNLMHPKHPTDRLTVRDIVVLGGTQGNVSNLMPPMGNDLTWTQVESVVDFVILLRQSPQQARGMLLDLRAQDQVSLRVGHDIFTSRCVLCHGKYGEGDGRMAKIIKTPPPADLTASRLPKDYLERIIKKGGAGVNRSPQMPPWEDQLNHTEIDSLILYLHSIRD